MTAPLHQRTTDEDAPVAPYAVLHETHSAIVLLVGGRAYKVKKPVDLGFLDFSTPTKRLRATQRELELNRRFAPDVYLGISDLNDPDGRPAEHVLTMRRMPAAARLAHLVRTGEDVSTGIVELAANVAALHRHAPRGPQIDACGRRDAVQERWRSNLTEARPYVGEWLDADAFGHVDRLCTRYLEGREPLFDARIEQGAVLDGHGDLLAEDVFLLSDGPRILDCLDFDDRLRYLDRVDDVACLVMDLEHLGAPAVAHRFLQAYLTAARDDPPDSLVHHYVAYRAFMRAKVSCFPGAVDHGRSGTSSLLELAHRHLEAGRVQLVLVGGAPGTGKTTVASRVADRVGAVHLSSDRVRKELAGVEPTTSLAAAYGCGIYTQDWTARTYDALLSRARSELGRGRSVILDATWGDVAHRTAASLLAHATSSDLSVFQCVAPHEVADARLAQRSEDGAAGVSDADPEVAAELRGRFADWPEATDLDTTRRPALVVAEVVHRLAPATAERHVPRPRLLPD